MIETRALSLRAGEFRLDDVDLSVGPGEYAVLMGPTGCGKTTLLEALCGLHALEGGSVWIGGRDVTRARPADRGVGYVPQDGALFGTMTVAEHLAFSLRVRGRPAGEVEATVAELASELRIAPLLERRPRGLSGGERQRVALGRALAGRPPVLLLDEPLAAIDEELREEMCTLLASLARRHALTVLHVTHNRAEAWRLGDRVLSLDGGAVHELEPPSDDA